VPLEQPGVARQCTKDQKQGLGVPLGIEGVARQPWHFTMACHLKAEAWHANYWNQDKIMGVPLEGLGVARQAGNEEHVTRQRHASHTPAEKSCLLSVFFSLQNVIFLFTFVILLFY